MAIGLVWASAILCLFIAVLAADIMGLFSSKNHFEVDGKTVVITGGSQGMGRGLGKLLAQKGANVVIVARGQQKLDDAIKYIASSAKNPGTQRFHTISADLTSPDENTLLLAKVTAWNFGHPPDIIWANAGSSHPALFIDTPISTLRSQMDINYWAATYLAHATLRQWLTQPIPKTNPRTTSGPKHFIITSSVACYCGIAGYTPYSPPKSALRSLADTLRSELNLYAGAGIADIKIHCVTPATITSPGYAEEEAIKHAVTKVLEEGDPAQDEDEVARASVRGLERGGVLVSTSWLGWAMKCGSLGNSPRSGWFAETVLSWVVSVVWLFVGPDMEGKVWKYGKEHGIEVAS